MDTTIGHLSKRLRIHISHRKKHRKNLKHLPCLYKRFSHTDNWPKFRVVFAFNEPFTYINLLNAHTDQLFKKYPYADVSIFQVEMLFFGSTDLYVFDYENKIHTNNSIIT